MASDAPPSLWEDIRRQFLAGAKPKQIVRSDELAKPCARFRIDAKAVSDRAYRERWRIERDETRKIVEENRPAAVADVIVREAIESARRVADIMRTAEEKALSIGQDLAGAIPFAAWMGGVHKLLQSRDLLRATPKNEGTLDGNGTGPPGRFVVVDPGE